VIKTPKEKATENAKIQKKNEEAFKRLSSDFDAVAATEEGLTVIKYLMNFCCYQKPTTSINQTTGEINREASLHLEARRSVYLEMRKFISARHLKKIEFK